MSDDKKILSLVGRREEKAAEADADKETAVQAFGVKLIDEAQTAVDAGIHGYILITVDRMGNPGITWHSGFNNQIPLMGSLPVIESQLVMEAVGAATKPEDPK